MTMHVPRDRTVLAAGVPAPLEGVAGALLEVRGLKRSFGETRALVSCSLSVLGGEIHAVVGENGSGKSTLIKILSGVLRPDGGTLLWAGSETTFGSPLQAQRAGIATVFQETLVADELSVRDNIFIGTDSFLRRTRDRATEEREARAVLAQLGLTSVDLDRPIWSLPLGQRQIVTIARALVRPWRLLILDESTSAPDIEDRDRLFHLLAAFKRRGAAVMFVSHRMDEIRRIADRVTVLRSGESITTLPADQAPTELLLRLMSSARAAEESATASGEPVDAQRAVVKACAPVRARVERLVLRDGAQPFDLELHDGEILGVAGLEGHGQVRFLECVAGLARAHRGHVLARVDGAWHPVGDLRDAFRKGIAYVPRDRKQEGLFAPLSVLDNLAMPILGRLSRGGVMRRRAVLSEVRRHIDRLQVRTPGPGATIASLSGGNQQKVLLGRWIATGPKLLILNDPLRGVDLGTKLDLYGTFRRLAGEGMAFLFLSTELEELCLLCDRVAVFREHALSAVLERPTITQQAIVEAMFGHAVPTAPEG